MNNILTENQRKKNIGFFFHRIHTWKGRNPLHLASKYIHNNWYTFFHFFCWRWDWLQVSVTKQSTAWGNMVLIFFRFRRAGCKTAFGGNKRLRRILARDRLFAWHDLWKHLGHVQRAHNKVQPTASNPNLRRQDRQSMIQVWGDVFCWSAEDACQVTAAFNRLKWLLLYRKYCWTLGLCTWRCLSGSWRCCIGQSCGYKHNDGFKTLKTLFSTELILYPQKVLHQNCTSERATDHCSLKKNSLSFHTTNQSTTDEPVCCPTWLNYH